MASSVRNAKSSAPHPNPSKVPSRAVRQKKPTKPVSDPAPNPSRPRSSVSTADQPPPRPARAPTLQHYPAVPYVMNPSYPVNPSPFTLPSGYPAPAAMNGAASGTGTPTHPQYYSMHPTPYAPSPHGYGPYPQYAQQMMVYTQSRPAQASAEQQQPQPASSPSTLPPTGPPSIGKRKRRADAVRDRAPVEKDSDHEGPSPSDLVSKHSPIITASPSTPTDARKRTKTQRACDSCRSRKIRCDILPDSDPQLCQHCRQYGFECTFFLPITETRFKKKKLEEDAAAEREKDKSDTRHTTTSPMAESADRRVFGPTNPVHLLHSQATISSRIYESYDQRYHHTWEVTKNGDGLISVQNLPGDEQLIPHPKAIDLHVEPEVIQELVNAYFQEIAPMLPIVTQAEFLSNPSPPSVLLYSMCLVAAARRQVPQNVFDSIRYILNSIIKAEDVLSTATIANVQALLILSMVADSHSQYVPNALSALWIRLGTAIRMAQDLGLHRAESVKQNIELRRRLWGACVICDRWTSLTYGHPFMIDVQDCDARLPSSGDPNDLYMDELVRLSIILGRVLKTIYSPSGLMLTTDAVLAELLADLESWKVNLPESLEYRGPETPRNAGLLHLLYSCVCMMFWRVFMRISYTCPTHLRFGLTVETWGTLVKLTGESIDWLDAHEHVYDVWLLVAYAATACALVQYHTWARQQDPDAAFKLRKLRDCVRRWEGTISADHMSARRKTAEIISLLYEATQGPPLPLGKPPLNPTGGVRGRQPLSGIEYKKDASRPGGGVFIAHGEARKADFGLPKGTIITSDDESEEQPDPGSSSLVNLRLLTSGNEDHGRGDANVNPTLNKMVSQSPGNVQVLNVLDGPQASGMLEQFAMADVGLLEGIPGGMFDWGQWSSFFTRLNSTASPGVGRRAGVAEGEVLQSQQETTTRTERP